MAIARQQQQQVAADRAGIRRQGEGLMTLGFCKAEQAPDVKAKGS